MNEPKRTLCVKEERYGTLDLWINPEGEGSSYGDNHKFHIIVTYDGKPITQFAHAICLDKGDPEQILDSLMGLIDRDTQNWYYKDLIIHWGVHTLKFTNNKNIDVVEKDEYVKNLEDIKEYYEVEW